MSLTENYYQSLTLPYYFFHAHIVHIYDYYRGGPCESLRGPRALQRVEPDPKGSPVLGELVQSNPRFDTHRWVRFQVSGQADGSRDSSQVGSLIDIHHLNCVLFTLFKKTGSMWTKCTSMRQNAFDWIWYLLQDRDCSLKKGFIDLAIKQINYFLQIITTAFRNTWTL